MRRVPGLVAAGWASVITPPLTSPCAASSPGLTMGQTNGEDALPVTNAPTGPTESPKGRAHAAEGGASSVSRQEGDQGEAAVKDGPGESVRESTAVESESLRNEDEKERQASLKTSKKFVDEDSRSPEYRSDEWRMKHFKASLSPLPLDLSPCQSWLPTQNHFSHTHGQPVHLHSNQTHASHRTLHSQRASQTVSPA